MIHTLERDNHKLTFCDRGATWRSWEVPGGRDILLGFETEEDYGKQDFYCGGVIGRFANRIAGASFPLHGRKVELVANEGTKQLHGGPEGYDRKLWSPTPGKDEQGSFLRFRLDSPDGDQGYPGKVKVEVTYRLHAGGRVTVAISGATDAPTVFNPTHHAYFNLAGSGTVHDHRVELEADFFLPAGDQSLPTGEVRSVADTALDFRQPVRLGDVLASGDPHLHGAPCVDSCFVARGEPGQLRRIARLSGAGLELAVAATSVGFHFYTGHYIPAQPTGRGGRAFGPSAGLAIEPGFFPNSPNVPHFPSPVLLPGRVFSSLIEFVCGPA